MADFSSFQPIVQASQQKDQIEQQQAINQMIQLGHLMTYREKQADLEADRKFKSYAMILAHPEFGDELKLKAVNAMAQQIGINGTVTMDGLRPMSGLFKQIMADYSQNPGGMDWSKYGPAMQMIQEHPTMIQQAQLADLPAAADAYNTHRATQAVDLANPQSNYVSEAKQRIQGRQAQLNEMRGQKEMWQATVDGTLGAGAAPVSADVKNDYQTKLGQLKQLEDDDRIDQAAVNEDTARTQLNERVVQFVKNNPDALKALEKYGLQAAGIYPSDDAYMKARYNQLLQIPENRRTPEDTRQLDLVQTYLTGKSAASMRNQLTVQRVTQELQGLKAESQNLDDATKTDAAAKEEAEQHRTVLSAITEGSEKKVQDEATWKALHEEATGYGTILGAAQNANLAANQDKADALLKDKGRLAEDIEDIRKQLPTTPAAQREDMRSKMRLKQDLMAAREAQAALLTTHSPLRQVDLELQAKMAEIDAAHQKSALANDALTTEERVALETSSHNADYWAKDTADKLKTFNSERNDYLKTMARTQASLGSQTRVLEQMKTGTQRAIEKDDATSQATQQVVTDMGGPMGTTLTKAVTQAVKDFPNADHGEVLKRAKGLMEHDYGQAVNYGQYIMTGLVNGQDKAELNDQELAGITRKAVKLTYEKTGVLVKADDLAESYRKGKISQKTQTIPTRNVSDAIEINGTWQVAEPLIEQIEQQVKEHPNFVGTPGIIQSWAASLSQQWGAMWAGVQRIPAGKPGSIDPVNGKLAYKYFSSAPADKMEAMMQPLIYLVARAMSPVGVISDQDADNARRMVGDTKSWMMGPEQILNRLAVVRGFFQGKVGSANSLLEEAGFTNFGTKAKRDEAEKEAGVPPDEQPATAEQYFKLRGR